MKSRDFCFTINNPTEDDYDFVYSLGYTDNVRYVCIGFEIGECGTPHFQGYILFHNARHFSSILNWNDRWHLEIRRKNSTSVQAMEYCKKDGDFYEYGDPPKSAESSGQQGAAERWALAKAGKFEELAPESIKIYEYIYAKFRKVEDRNILDNIWVYGPSGCGKSTYARRNFPIFYNKNCGNKWWDGYAGEEVVLFDDFSPDHAKYISDYMKNWCDHFAFNAEVKGGMLHIRPKTIIVTSQYTIEECFSGCPQALEAINRRFKFRYSFNPVFSRMGWEPNFSRVELEEEELFNQLESI